MTDPLGAGTLAGAVDDVQGLVTGTYVPVMIGAIIFGVGLRIAFRWVRRAATKAGG
jgi:hypothetical protein